MEGYIRGQPVVRHFCLDCADGAAPWREAAAPERRLRLTTLVAISGVVLLVIGLLGDYLVPDRHFGFGWRQQSGLWLSIVVLLIGLLLRVDLLALAGVFLLGVSLGADWFGLVSGPGIGWKQQYMAATGAFLLLGSAAARLGCWAARRGDAAQPVGRRRSVPEAPSVTWRG